MHHCLPFFPFSFSYCIVCSSFFDLLLLVTTRNIICQGLYFHGISKMFAVFECTSQKNIAIVKNKLIPTFVNIMENSQTYNVFTGNL